MWNHQRGTGTLLAGLILITLGVLFLLDNMHMLAFRWVFRDWWPMLLILIGVVQLLTRGMRRLVWPLVLITLGVLFQGEILYWWRFHELWPVILIAIGAGILVKRLREPAETHGDTQPLNAGEVK